MPEQKFVKTRIAPTPSGYLHAGNALSFILTKVLAEKTGAKILLRIDDLDQERVRKEYVQDIFDTLDFLGIEWHEGPRDYEDYKNHYSQTHRMDHYTNALQKLLEKNAVFSCTCSRSMLDGTYHGQCRSETTSLHSAGNNWRMITENVPAIKINTLQGPHSKEIPPQMHSFIVRKKDGRAAYQLSSIVDDLHFGVDLVVRGEDLWPSTIAQVYLSHVLQQPQFAATTFYHHHLLHDKKGKLSKSAGSLSIQELRKQHKKPADIYRLIARESGIQENISTEKELVERLLRMPAAPPLRHGDH
jgi:glutamyl/glutaminyl-tRNA synthetase